MKDAWIAAAVIALWPAAETAACPQAEAARLFNCARDGAKLLVIEIPCARKGAATARRSACFTRNPLSATQAQSAAEVEEAFERLIATYDRDQARWELADFQAKLGRFCEAANVLGTLKNPEFDSRRAVFAANYHFQCLADSTEADRAVSAAAIRPEIQRELLKSKLPRSSRITVYDYWRQSFYLKGKGMPLFNTHSEAATALVERHEIPDWRTFMGSLYGSGLVPGRAPVFQSARSATDPALIATHMDVVAKGLGR